jgi:hypothetical protein
VTHVPYSVTLSEKYIPNLGNLHFVLPLCVLYQDYLFFEIFLFFGKNGPEKKSPINCLGLWVYYSQKESSLIPTQKEFI